MPSIECFTSALHFHISVLVIKHLCNVLKLEKHWPIMITCKKWLDSNNKTLYLTFILVLTMQNAVHFLLSHFVLITLHLFSVLLYSNSNQNKQILTVQIFVVLDQVSALQNTVDVDASFNFRLPRRQKNCQTQPTTDSCYCNCAILLLSNHLWKMPH